MSSHPPMEKLALTADPPRDLVAARRLHLGSAATLTDVAKTLKSTLISRSRKHIKHISPVPHRGHLPRSGLKYPGRDTERPFLISKTRAYVGSLKTMCGSCGD
jgi:hypothetical protein